MKHLTKIGSCLAAVTSLGLVLASCKKDEAPPGEETLAARSSGAYGERRDDDGRMKTVVGAWRLGGTTILEFLDQNRDALEIPDGVEFGEPQLLDAGATRIDLSYDGKTIYGGSIIVHTVQDYVVWVALNVPTGFAENSTPIPATEAEGSVGDSIGDSVLGWVAPGMVLSGEPTEARLAWWVRTDAETHWVDASSGEVVFSEPTRIRDLRVFDAGNSLNLKSVENEDSKLIYVNGRPQPNVSPDPEAEAANTHSQAACQRRATLYNEVETCGSLDIFVDTGLDSTAAFAQCSDWRGTYCAEQLLGFGAETLVVPTGRRTFEHELWHVLIGRTARLSHLGEAGAVNEAFADANSFLAVRPDGWVVGVGDYGTTDFTPDRNISEPQVTAHPSHRNQYRVIDGGAKPSQENDYGHVHVNSVILSHGIWRAVTQGGAASLAKDWAPIGYDKFEPLIYRASIQLSSTPTLRDAADQLIFECGKEVISSVLEGRAPAAGLTESDCGSVVNAMAEVGLSAPDRDVDGLPDSIDPCPEDADIMQLLQYDEEVGCAEPVNNVEPDPEPDMGPGPVEPVVCEGPGLTCPATFTGADGLELQLFIGTDEHCFRTVDDSGVRDDKATVASCSYQLEVPDPELGSAGVRFTAFFHTTRYESGRGCLVDESGQDLFQPTDTFGSASARAWVEFSGASAGDEDSARRQFANGLLAQFESDAVPCNTVMCPSFVDSTGEHEPAFPGNVPVIWTSGDRTYTRADCRYEPSGLVFAIQSAEETGESVLCPDMPAEPDGLSVYDQLVQARVNFPGSGDTSADATRRSIANQMFDQVRDRALACP